MKKFDRINPAELFVSKTKGTAEQEKDSRNEKESGTGYAPAPVYQSRIDREQYTKRAMIPMAPSMKKAAEEKARKNGITFSEYVRQLIRDDLA